MNCVLLLTDGIRKTSEDSQSEFSDPQFGSSTTYAAIDLAIN